MKTRLVVEYVRVWWSGAEVLPAGHFIVQGSGLCSEIAAFSSSCYEARPFDRCISVPDEWKWLMQAGVVARGLKRTRLDSACNGSVPATGNARCRRRWTRTHHHSDGHRHAGRILRRGSIGYGQVLTSRVASLAATESFSQSPDTAELSTDTWFLEPASPVGLFTLSLLPR